MKSQSALVSLRPNVHRHWVLFVVCFYAAWGSLVFLEELGSALLAHWHIALSMAFGSFVAGSSPMGGGTVGFPILVLLFDQTTTMGRDFSFAIQSVGMTSASILILLTRQRLAWPVLWGALPACVLWTPLALVAEIDVVSVAFGGALPDAAGAILFAIVWAAFGVMHLLRAGEFAKYKDQSPMSRSAQAGLGFVLGTVGSVLVAAPFGSGVDMVVYCGMVLLMRTDLRIAIPTSVLVMALTSVVGITTRLATDSVEPAVFAHWVAAAPVVIIGAPLGVLAVSAIGRIHALQFVAALCVLQFVWACYDLFPYLQWDGVSRAVAGASVLVALAESLRMSNFRLPPRAGLRLGQGPLRYSPRVT